MLHWRIWLILVSVFFFNKAGSNKIGPKGAASIGALVNLTILRIGNNNLGEEGAAHLANLKQLTLLNISRNMIGEKGALIVATLR